MTENTALIVIDVLVGIFELPEKVYREKDLLNNTQQLVEKARGNGVPIFYAQHYGPDGTPFAKGNKQREIHPCIKPKENDTIVEKCNPDSFHGTGLDNILREKGIDRILICGFASEGCIDSTVRGAFSREYKVTLIKDGHSTTKNIILDAKQIYDHHNFVLSRFAELQSVADVKFED